MMFMVVMKTSFTIQGLRFYLPVRGIRILLICKTDGQTWGGDSLTFAFDTANQRLYCVRER